MRRAAGELSATSSELTTVRPASFFGVTSTSPMVGSLTSISAPSAVQAAVGSAETTGTRRVVDPIGTMVDTWAATDCSISGWMTRAPTSSGVRAAALDVLSDIGFSLELKRTQWDGTAN